MKLLWNLLDFSGDAIVGIFELEIFLDIFKNYPYALMDFKKLLDALNSFKITSIANYKLFENLLDSNSNTQSLL